MQNVTGPPILLGLPIDAGPHIAPVIALILARKSASDRLYRYSLALPHQNRGTI